MIHVIHLEMRLQFVASVKFTNIKIWMFTSFSGTLRYTRYNDHKNTNNVYASYTRRTSGYDLNDSFKCNDLMSDHMGNAQCIVGSTVRKPTIIHKVIY